MDLESDLQRAAAGGDPILSMNPADTADSPARVALRRSVLVRAPGRLHLGFLDPSASLGRRFGSIGLMLDGFETELELGATEPGLRPSCTAGSPGAAAQLDRVESALLTLQRQTGRDQPLNLHLRQVPPAHAGFGSGTQLALAVGRAFARWHGLTLPTATLAAWLGRGLRSGVGIAGFDQGGLLVDGGPSADGRPAPLLARLTLPSAWRVLLVLDPQSHGLSGRAEREAIAALPPLPRGEAADICHQLLMRVLPGAADGDFAAFAAGVTQIQRVIGRHFAPAQRGSAYASAAVGRAIEALADAAGGDTGAAIGQSSWGPTAFAVLPSQARAEALLMQLRAQGGIAPSLECHVLSARDHGAEIIDRMADAPRR